MIETVQEWNTRLGYCGCCPMPVCPEPLMVCESKSVTTTPSDIQPVPDPLPDDTTWLTGGAGYVPFEVEGAAPGDPLPALYASLKTTHESPTYNGIYAIFSAETVTGNYTVFRHLKQTLELNGLYTERLRRQVYLWISGAWSLVEDVDNTSPPTDPRFGAGFADGAEWTRVREAEPDCDALTPTLYRYLGYRDEIPDSGTDLGDPWPSPPFGNIPATEYFSDCWIEGGDTEYELGAPIYLSDLTDAPITDEYAPGVCVSALDVAWPTVGTYPCPPSFDQSIASAQKTAVRVRFRIPNTHLGSKFYITYDIGEVPDDGDPFYVSRDNVLEWTGPGTGDQDDPSWLTEWVEIDPPDAPGERRIVNIRYTCYSGTKFGVKPQVMGEALEIPEP